MFWAKAMSVVSLRDGVQLACSLLQRCAGKPRMHELIRGAESTCECVQNTSNLVVRAAASKFSASAVLAC